MRKIVEASGPTIDPLAAAMAEQARTSDLTSGEMDPPVVAAAGRKKTSLR